MLLQVSVLLADISNQANVVDGRPVVDLGLVDVHCGQGQVDAEVLDVVPHVVLSLGLGGVHRAVEASDVKVCLISPVAILKLLIVVSRILTRGLKEP